MALTLTNSLGGIGNSYALINDLKYLSFPVDGQTASITSASLTTPLNVLGLNLKLIITEDGIPDNQLTFTFSSNYTTIDALVSAISIPKVKASNSGGRLRIETIKRGISQQIQLDHTSTANSLLKFSTLNDSIGYGRSTITNELDDDEMTYSLVSASSICNGYLKRRYGLPLKQWGYDLIQVVCDIAAYNLLKRKGFNPVQYDSAFEDAYNRGIKWLEDVGNRREHPEIIDSGHFLIPNASTYNIEQDQRGWERVIGFRD